MRFWVATRHAISRCHLLAATSGRTTERNGFSWLWGPAVSRQQRTFSATKTTRARMLGALQASIYVGYVFEIRTLPRQELGANQPSNHVWTRRVVEATFSLWSLPSLIVPFAPAIPCASRSPHPQRRVSGQRNRWPRAVPRIPRAIGWCDRARHHDRSRCSRRAPGRW